MSNQPNILDFHRYETPEEQFRFLLQFAVLAPSSHNSQPWLWELDGDEVTLRADRSRSMPALDPDGRELIISCGAALQHLCLAIRATGHAALIQLWPDPADEDLLARVRLGSSRPPTPQDEMLCSFIGKRHTHRGRFEERELPTKLLFALQQAALQEGALLALLGDEKEREDVILLIERGEVALNRYPAVRRDVADWIAPSGSRDDGIPAQALGIGSLMSHVAPLTHRILDRGLTLASKAGRLAQNAPVLSVLCTAEEGPQAWLAAGQALGNVLLTARSEGVWASFFSQPIQVDEGWSQLRQIIGTRDFPQLVFRLGYAAPIEGTPRRHVDEVIASTIPK